MNMDGMQLGRVMIHDVPRGGSDDPPTLTNTPVELDESLLTYFQKKLTTSLKTRGIEVVADPEADGTVRDAVTAILKDSATLAEQSRAAATHLAATQNGHNPAGLLTVIEVTLDTGPGVAVMKLERESGIRFDITKDGEYAKVNLELLRQLTLTNKTKVFKTALFTNPDISDPLAIVGRASDNQRGQAEGRAVADFYLNTYLGCRHALNPARTTQTFVKTVTDFVNATDMTPETRGRYCMALLTELHSNNIDISPKQFVHEHIGVEHRSDLLGNLREQGLEPGTAFQKDTTLVRYEKIRVVFDSGIVLVGTGQDVNDHVRFRDDDEQPGVDVNDLVKTVEGR